MAGAIRQHCRAVLRCLRWTQWSADCVVVSNSTFPEVETEPKSAQLYCTGHLDVSSRK